MDDGEEGVLHKRDCGANRGFTCMCGAAQAFMEGLQVTGAKGITGESAAEKLERYTRGMKG